MLEYNYNRKIALKKGKIENISSTNAK